MNSSSLSPPTLAVKATISTSPSAWKIRYPLEIGLLAGLAFFLPGLEGAKNLLWMGYCLVWLTNRVKDGELTLPGWDRWDSLIAIWIISGYLAAAFAGLPGKQWNGSNDLLRYGSVLWLIKRSGYGWAETKIIFIAMLAGLMPTIAYGFWRAYIIKKKQFLELHSVGHVNHSSQYLAVAAGMALSVLVACGLRLQKGWRYGLLAALLVTTAALALTSSRTAIFSFVVFVILLAVFWRSKPIALFLGLAIALGIAAEFVPGTWGVASKFKQNIATKELASQRDKIWLLGLQAVREFPAFGVGIDNYSKITIDRACEWHAQRAEPCPKERYAFAPHAHGLAVNTLAERGLVGFCALLLVFVSWSVVLWRTRKVKESAPRALWGACLAALVINIAGGTFNTSLHHEIAILSVMGLGFFLALRGEFATHAT
jgi:O-Antigen ligase